MNISDISPVFYNYTDAIKPSNIHDAPLKNIYGRDVIIINPCCDGGGDIALAKKIANIVLEEGCRVTIVLIDVRKNYAFNQNYALQHDLIHDLSQLENPLFIITPLSIADINKLKMFLNDICDKFNFQPQDALLIEEMDLLIREEKQLIYYEEMLKEIGFSKIVANNLGFDEGAIGYIPTDEKNISEIKGRFEGELVTLFDSYNLSFSAEDSYHLGYISSGSYSSGAQVYIANTLCEILADSRNANFIMSLRQVSLKDMSIVVNAITNIISPGDSDMLVDYSSLYSTVKISVIDSDDGCVKIRKDIIGSGTKKVQIILVNRLPKNIYDDFLLLASTGMMSGDQSFSEYLTLKGTLPYYDMQPWKYPLVQSIKKLAGRELEHYVDQRVVGRRPYSGEILYSFIDKYDQPILSSEQRVQKKQLDETLTSRIATPYLKGVIRDSLKNS